MSAKGMRSTTPSNGSGGAHYLPIGLVDIELSTPPTELVDDTTIFLLGPDQEGSPSAVLKVARGLLGTAELRTQRRVLSELAIHPGLDGEWRELLPRVLAFDERAEATLSVESFRPGIDLAEALACQPDRVEELTATALRAIAPLHRRTTTFVGVDNAIMLWRWLVGPLAGLADMCRRLDPVRAVQVNRLSRMLRRDVRAWRMPVGWTHGSFTPGNVLVDGVQGRVTGIVDWGGGGPGRPALIDEYLMILTASCQVQGADLGTVVTERLRAGGLLGRERNALHAARDRSGPHADDRPLDAGGVDECVAVLLTWLHHVADLWRKRATQPNHHVWWATNVAPVIDFAAAWYPGDAGYFPKRRGGE
ncbi:phosphotransferase family protein [Mycobacterium helveticum]|uniref:Aminoglycoside phosphotransferase family protein n=1 Tax=Mycobacterium helveticum TaxID=2592811 RepID=A0A557XZZ3_9MYCO|nr:aminoglycoside phosphotransferase family protein [Mycobacterium helveticum]TVS89904.1 aminoglycoside phosphotransferase family protein [Mycobacterium helveticum]TVS91848.1 aminoglycoside phosphotransferase family protein [Mycobacterium helveticum]